MIWERERKNRKREGENSELSLGYFDLILINLKYFIIKSENSIDITYEQYRCLFRHYHQSDISRPIRSYMHAWMIVWEIDLNVSPSLKTIGPRFDHIFSFFYRISCRLANTRSIMAVFRMFDLPGPKGGTLS